MFINAWLGNGRGWGPSAAVQAKPRKRQARQRSEVAKNGMGGILHIINNNYYILYYIYSSWGLWLGCYVMYMFFCLSGQRTKRFAVVTTTSSRCCRKRRVRTRRFPRVSTFCFRQCIASQLPSS